MRVSSVSFAPGMGKLINNIMTAVFFELSGVLPTEQALALLKASAASAASAESEDMWETCGSCKDAVKKTYKNKGDAIVNQYLGSLRCGLFS